MSQSVLITGANRGVGLELAKAYLERGWKVIAAVRDPKTMPKLQGEVVTVKLDAGQKDDARRAVAELQGQGIKKVDVVIANAAINLSPGTSFKDIDVDEQMETLNVNVRGPLVLFQATWDLLEPHKGKYVVISSGAGTIGQKHGGKGNGIYGQSKAALNFFVAKAHAENPDRIVLALNPGWVPTEMGNAGARVNGMEVAPGKFSETIPGMLKNIDEATKDTTSGFMIDWYGTVFLAGVVLLIIRDGSRMAW